VSVGEENFSFSAGPFSVLGGRALQNDKSVCDFDAVVETIPAGGRVQLIVISYRVYMEAQVHSTVRQRANIELKSATPRVKPAAVSDNSSEPVSPAAAALPKFSALSDDVRVDIEGDQPTSATLLLEDDDPEGKDGDGGGGVSEAQV